MSKIAIMQPYFFPYIGYYSLIHAAKTIVLFDTPQYDRKGWMSRNRILKPQGNDWQYIKAKIIKNDRFAPICDISLSPDDDWKNRLLAQLEHYRNDAPYYSQAIALVKDVLFAEHNNNLVQLCRYSIEKVCDYIGLDCTIKIFSEMGMELPEIRTPGEWALRITEALEVGVYINPPGGREIFDLQEYKKHDIKILFLHHSLPEYRQKREQYIPGLSIIDILMFNGPRSVLKMVSEYELKE